MNQQTELIREEALLRMQMSQEFMKYLKRAYEIFEDPEALIGKGITATTFWFFIDSLYFTIDPPQHSNKLAQLGTLNRHHYFQFEELEDLQFILKLRKLVSKEKMGTLNIADIKSTSIDELIEISENYLTQINHENSSKLEILKQKELEDSAKIKEELEKFNIKFRYSHPMFYYEQLQAILRAKWNEQQIKMQAKDKCFLCGSPNKLITCNTCSLKVHAKCYPTFANKYDAKVKNPSEEELRKFVCQNCVNKVDGDNQKCQLCCCVGGNFVKTSQDEEGFKITFSKDTSSEESVKNTYISLKMTQDQGEKVQKFVHLTCFIWNTELKWNSMANTVEGISKTTKKKFAGACSLCGIGFGAVVPCSNETCRRFYHGQCARRHGLEMNLIRAKTSVIQLYCERHRHLNRCQSLQQTELNRFREVKKMLQGLDKEIKRLHVTSTYQQVKLVVQRDYCSVCGKEQGWQKITICKQCRKWYHNNCSTNCKNCA